MQWALEGGIYCANDIAPPPCKPMCKLRERLTMNSGDCAELLRLMRFAAAKYWRKTT